MEKCASCGIDVTKRHWICDLDPLVQEPPGTETWPVYCDFCFSKHECPKHHEEGCATLVISDTQTTA